MLHIIDASGQEEHFKPTPGLNLNPVKSYTMDY